MRPMTLAQYYDEGRLRSYVDDIVSYEQFAERFFERIKDDKRGKEGEKLGTNFDVNDDKESTTWKKKKKKKKKKYRAYRMDCSGDHCVLPEEQMCKPPTEEELYDENGPFMKKWRDEFDFDWLEYADDLEHPVTVASSGKSPRKAMKESKTYDEDDEELYKNIIKKRKSKPDDEETKKRRKAPLVGRADLEEFARMAASN